MKPTTQIWASYKAREFFERALQADPSYARARAYIAYTCHREQMLDIAEDAEMAVERGVEEARAAIALDPNDADTHTGFWRSTVIGPKIMKKEFQPPGRRWS